MIAHADNKPLIVSPFSQSSLLSLVASSVRFLTSLGMMKQSVGVVHLESNPCIFR